VGGLRNGLPSVNQSKAYRAQVHCQEDDGDEEACCQEDDGDEEACGQEEDDGDEEACGQEETDEEACGQEKTVAKRNDSREK
jgi:hypothetical protein